MATYKTIGAFRGRHLFQKRGEVGGYRNVFVKLQGVKNELVYPTFGGVIMNPFKGDAKAFAGDLCWYKTNDKGVKPEVYILKTYEVTAANGNILTINKDGNYRHIPFAGDVLMVAPATIGGSGLAATVLSVTDMGTTWQITTSEDISSGISDENNILVEATTNDEGNTYHMLVENINAVCDCDCDFFGAPNIVPGTNIVDLSDSDTNYDADRYLYAPALGGLMYKHKMSPIPACVEVFNTANVNGWFEVGYRWPRGLYNVLAGSSNQQSVVAEN